MKVIMLEALSGDKVYESGSEQTFPDTKALNLIRKGIAKAKTKKDYEAALKKEEAAEQKRIETEEKAAAILYREDLEQEKARLEERLKKIDSLLSLSDNKELLVAKEEDEKPLEEATLPLEEQE